MAVRQFAVALALSAGSSLLVSAAPTLQCCTLLASRFPSDVLMPNTTQYEFERTDFWSATEWLDPRCVFLPDTTEKVSVAVQLFAENDCTFSIKGGGHSAIPGAANIDGGVLIPTKEFNTVDINFEEGNVRIGMGLVMGEIYAALDPYNLTVAIGRFENVGTGVLLGAGISYLINGVGFATDNIINFEVVLADGTITNANATHNADLFKALKGGNNNFAVVTHVTLISFPTEGAIYGGQIFYSEEYLDQVSDVVYDYHTRQAVEDTLTHVLPQFAYNGTTDEAISFNPIMYNRDVNELPEIMQGWTDIPAYQNTMQNRDYSNLTVELNDGYPNGLVQEQRVFTVYADNQLYKDLWNSFLEWCRSYRHISGFYCLHVNMPITPRAMAASVEKGGNVLGLEDAADQVLGIIYFGITFDSMDDAAEVLPAHSAFQQEMINMAKCRNLWHPYIMLTYSGWDQPVIESYGEENVAYLLEVSAKYDPTGVFQRLVPGNHKLPARD